MKTTRVAALGIASALLLTGCGWTGLNSVPLPLTKGASSDDLRVTVLLQNSTNLVANSEVKYDDVTVGSVRKIEFDNWHAKLTLGIEKDAHVPANVIANVAQKSLLGAEYLDLSAPQGSAEPTAAAPLLRDGAVLGLDRTGRYPETEEVLSAAALLLNNGGLGQVRTIAHELNAALDGRTGDVRQLVSRISIFTHALDEQRGAILDSLDHLDRLSKSVNASRATVAKALDAIPPAVEQLARERQSLVRALTALDRLSTVSHRVISATRADLDANLANLRPLTKQFADHSRNLAQSLDEVTWPFPIKAINKAFYGDYINFFAQLNIDVSDLAKYWTGGTALEALVAPFMGLPSSTATGSANPLTGPLDPTSSTNGGGQAVQNLLSGLISGLQGTGSSSSDESSTDAESNPLGGLLGGGH
jgi:phospholipid/cholesterol/gamma-HCH transport system substrate-binding protein